MTNSKKLISGINGQGDSGVSTRLFGTLLTYLNDHISDVYFVGTSNDISRLPPELSRAERFDGVFMIDLPGPKERGDYLGDVPGRRLGSRPISSVPKTPTGPGPRSAPAAGWRHCWTCH